MKKMRKNGRLQSAEWAGDVFDRAPYVTMSMVRPDGTPYGVPISAIRTAPDTFYIHCASEGEKIDCIKANPVVSLSAVTKCAPAFEAEKGNYTMHYRSAIALGRAEEVTDPEEKTMALRALCERFLPAYMDQFDQAIERSLGITTVIRIRLTEPPVGKEKK